jgi:hypothetical protein
MSLLPLQLLLPLDEENEDAGLMLSILSEQEIHNNGFNIPSVATLHAKASRSGVDREENDCSDCTEVFRIIITALVHHYYCSQFHDDDGIQNWSTVSMIIRPQIQNIRNQTTTTVVNQMISSNSPLEVCASTNNNKKDNFTKTIYLFMSHSNIEHVLYHVSTLVVTCFTLV